MRGKDLLEDMEFLEDELVEEAVDGTKHTAADAEGGLKGHRYRRKPARRKNWYRWGSLAACLLCICLAGTVVMRKPWRGIERNVMEEAVEAVYDVMPPEKAETGAKEAAPAEAAWEENATEDGIVEPAADVALAEDKQSATAAKYRSKYRIVSSYETNMIACYAAPEPGTYFCGEVLKQAMQEYHGQSVLFYVCVDIFATDGDAVTELRFGKDGSTLVGKEYERLYEAGYDVELRENTIWGYFTEEELNHFEPKPDYGYLFLFEGE